MNRHDYSTNSESQTSMSLLGRLRTKPTDADWESFVQCYGPKVLGWARGRGLQPADAQDITQTVLQKLLQKLQTYDPNRGRFRFWLKSVTDNAARDFIRGRDRRALTSADDDLLERLTSAVSHQDLFARLQREIEEHLLQVAMEMVKSRVPPHHWQVFMLSRFEEKGYEEIAQQLELSAPNARMIHSRVLAKVKQQFDDLNRGGDDE